MRVGTVDDGYDLTADKGTVLITPSSPDTRPDDVGVGDSGALVALLAGQMPVDAASKAQPITGDLAAVRRVIGGMPAAVAEFAS